MHPARFMKAPVQSSLASTWRRFDLACYKGFRGVQLFRRVLRLICGFVAIFALWPTTEVIAQNTSRDTVPVDIVSTDPATGSRVVIDPSGLRLTWPVSATETGEIVFNLNPAPNQPLIERIALGTITIVRNIEPVTFLTIGERDLRNPAGWVAFFDNPPLRSHQTVPAVLKKTGVRVASAGARTRLRFDEVTAGGFRGGLEISVFRHSPMIFIETVVSTEEDRRAILYDAGLLARNPSGSQPAPWSDPSATTYSPLVPGSPWNSFAWLDARGEIQRSPVDLSRVASPLTVNRRILVAESEGGAIAVFPPPHQYFYPLDSANNLGFAWYGSARNPSMNGYGFGIRQPPEGDRIWVPWVNAPPGTDQRLGVFYMLAKNAEEAIGKVSRLTRSDRYKPLAGYRTFSSHYHIEHALELTKARTDQHTTGIPREFERPGFVTTFKARGVDIVHLGEFHVGSMPRLSAAERLPLLKTLHEECARLSDSELLILPGEEPNVHLGGHWMSFFPKPVYWILNRAKDAPFVEEVPGYGDVYHVGSAADVLELMQRENGLMWTAHPRIKGSRTFPDAYAAMPFYRSEHFLGAAWKAMPADLSQPRLGKRVLDLLDEMANAGERKYVVAEADLFRVEPSFESYAHMNVNYLRLDNVPAFGDGWHTVLDALRGGKFFASTGEVLIPEFTVRGKRSGETLVRGASSSGEVLKLEATIEGTFPLAFAEIISGDGTAVHRQRVELGDTESFATRQVRLEFRRGQARWVRLEVWDIARNGAFTQPVWIE